MTARRAPFEPGEVLAGLREIRDDLRAAADAGATAGFTGSAEQVAAMWAELDALDAAIDELDDGALEALDADGPPTLN